MNVLWADGFEIDSWAITATAGYTLLSTPVITVINSTAHQDGGGRGGSRCINSNPSSGALLQGIITPALASPYCVAGAWRLNNSSASTTVGFVVQFRLSGNVQCCVFFRSDGFVQAFRNTTAGTSLGVSAGTVLVGVWQWFSIEANVANAGAFNVYVNGALVLTVAGDNQQQASPGFDQVLFGTIGDAAVDLDLDDITITDNTETEIPEQYWVLLAPTGNGTPLQFTPSAGTNWENVDENPPSSADYNETATTAQVDLYTYPNLPFVPTAISAVQSVLYASRDGSITGFASRIESASFTTAGPTVSPAAAGVDTLAYAFFPTDPATSADWTESAVNAIEAGIRSV